MENGGVTDPAASTRLQGSAYPDDDGTADAALAAALTAYAADPAAPAAHETALDALTRARVLVPVVAVLGEVEHDEAGLAHDKSSDMAAVLLTGADGRLALLGFTSTATMAAWDAQARPVPVPAQVAAATAVQEGAAALLLDVAGPVRLVVEGEDLAALAAGWTLGRVAGRSAWIGASGESSDSILR